MFFSYKQVIEEEYKAYLKNQIFVLDNNIMNAFTPARREKEYNIKRYLTTLWNDRALANVIRTEVDDLNNIANEWEEQRKLTISSEIKKDRDYFRIERDVIYKDLYNHGFQIDDDFDLTKFPGLRIMEYSHFCRIHGTLKSIKPNDVMDIKICTVAPYVDAIITENFQADVYKKAGKYIDEVKDLEVIRISELKGSR